MRARLPPPLDPAANDGYWLLLRTSVMLFLKNISVFGELRRWSLPLVLSFRGTGRDGRAMGLCARRQRDRSSRLDLASGSCGGRSGYARASTPFVPQPYLSCGGSVAVGVDGRRPGCSRARAWSFEWAGDVEAVAVADARAFSFSRVEVRASSRCGPCGSNSGYCRVCSTMRARSRPRALRARLMPCRALVGAPCFPRLELRAGISRCAAGAHADALPFHSLVLCCGGSEVVGNAAELWMA
ncbi:hypothetical protein DFH06DRAFT_1332157 [Mycena polygramma]|nr:hypothetical protein DFH06DRAFT_1332157 [Mycena polygramma]